MFVHICYTMIYTCMMHIIIYRSNSHTNIACCKFNSNLKPLFDSQFSVAHNTSLLEDSKECVLHRTLCWLRADTWDIILRNVWDTGRCLQASHKHTHSHTRVHAHKQTTKEEKIKLYSHDTNCRSFIPAMIDP